MASVNKVILVGRLGKDPEIGSVPSGTAKVKFSLATDEKFTDRNGEKQERTEWHNIVAWGKLGEICGQYLKKGKLVYIEGSIRTDTYDGKDGEKKRWTEIVATQMTMLDRRGDEEGGGSSGGGGEKYSSNNAAKSSRPAPQSDDDEEVPF